MFPESSNYEYASGDPCSLQVYSLILGQSNYQIAQPAALGLIGRFGKGSSRHTAEQSNALLVTISSCRSNPTFVGLYWRRKLSPLSVTYIQELPSESRCSLCYDLSYTQDSGISSCSNLSGRSIATWTHQFPAYTKVWRTLQGAAGMAEPNFKWPLTWPATNRLINTSWVAYMVEVNSKELERLERVLLFHSVLDIPRHKVLAAYIRESKGSGDK